MQQYSSSQWRGTNGNCLSFQCSKYVIFQTEEIIIYHFNLYIKLQLNIYEYISLIYVIFCPQNLIFLNKY